MSEAQPPAAPHEPEIEFLGKLAHGFLATARVVLWLAGAAAISYGCWQLLRGTTPPMARGDASMLAPITASIVWFPLGLPLVLPADWLVTRHRYRIWLLLVCALLWFIPMLLGDASRYGYILRMFATLISFLSLLVWRTLWQLTKPTDPTT